MGHALNFMQDAFFPEFQTIRATGMLPTGQPVPSHLRSGFTPDNVHQATGTPPTTWENQFGLKTEGSLTPQSKSSQPNFAGGSRQKSPVLDIFTGIQSVSNVKSQPNGNGHSPYQPTETAVNNAAATGNGLSHTSGNAVRQNYETISSNAAAASATLFGVNTAIGAYDLNAPAAAKANVSGNPFA